MPRHPVALRGVVRASTTQVAPRPARRGAWGRRAGRSVIATLRAAQRGAPAPHNWKRSPPAGGNIMIVMFSSARARALLAVHGVGERERSVVLQGP